MDPRYSNYPRAGMAPGGGGYAFNQRPPGAYFESISEAFNIIRADFGTWIVVSLLTLIISYAVSFPLSFAVSMVSTGSIINTTGSFPFTPLAIVLNILSGGVTWAVRILLVVGQGLMGLRASRGERPQIGDLFAPLRYIGPVFLTSLIVAFAIEVGLVFLIVPGIVLAGLLIMAPFAAAEQGLAPGDALKWSVDTCKPHLWNIAWVGFCASFVSGLGIFACCVGYLVTAPIFGIVLGLTYGTFRNPVAPPAPFMAYPPPGPVVPPTEGTPPPPPPGL